jgi:hypothetical protein
MAVGSAAWHSQPGRQSAIHVGSLAICLKQCGLCPKRRRPLNPGCMGWGVLGGAGKGCEGARRGVLRLRASTADVPATERRRRERVRGYPPSSTLVQATGLHGQGQGGRKAAPRSRVWRSGKLPGMPAPEQSTFRNRSGTVAVRDCVPPLSPPFRRRTSPRAVTAAQRRMNHGSPPREIAGSEGDGRAASCLTSRCQNQINPVPAKLLVRMGVHHGCSIDASATAEHNGKRHKLDVPRSRGKAHLRTACVRIIEPSLTIDGLHLETLSGIKCGWGCGAKGS